MSTSVQPMTADDLWHLPDDGRLRELVRGELRTMCPAGEFHGHLGMQIAIHLGAHVNVHRLGRTYGADTGFLIARDPDTVRAPDAAFVRRERCQALGHRTRYWPEAPDLAVEVISPSDRLTEVQEKVHDWLDASCRMVIVVNPRSRSASIHRSRTEVVELTLDDALDGGDVVPGWRLPLRELFEDDAENVDETRGDA